MKYNITREREELKRVSSLRTRMELVILTERGEVVKFREGGGRVIERDYVF